MCGVFNREFANSFFRVMVHQDSSYCSLPRADQLSRFVRSTVSSCFKKSPWRSQKNFRRKVRKFEGIILPDRLIFLLRTKQLRCGSKLGNMKCKLHIDDFQRWSLTVGDFSQVLETWNSAWVGQALLEPLLTGDDDDDYEEDQEDGATMMMANNIGRWNLNMINTNIWIWNVYEYEYAMQLDRVKPIRMSHCGTWRKKTSRPSCWSSKPWVCSYSANSLLDNMAQSSVIQSFFILNVLLYILNYIYIYVSMLYV